MRTIKEDYKTYIKNVASFIEKETVQYDDLLNNENIKKEQEDFFREVFHILKSFLNEEDSKILFIKIPVHELGIKLKGQESNWYLLQKTVSDVLCLATADKQKLMIDSHDLNSSAIGDIVYCHNDNSGNNFYPQFFEITASNQPNIPAKPKLILDGKKYLTLSEAIQRYNQNRNCIFRMKSRPSSSDQRTMRHIENVYNRINYYIDNRFDTQYDSALVVGFTDDAKRYERTYSNIYFDSPVSFTKRYSENDIDNEVVCFVGDKKYAGVWDDVQRGIGQGRIKKAIFIGSVLEDFKDIENQRLYEFSFRDIYHHFVHDCLDHDCFPQISCEHIRFKWLEEKLLDLNKIIDEIPSIDDQQRKHLITHILWNYVGCEIVNPNEEICSKLSDFIYENLFISNEDEDKILDWFNVCTYEGNSPKTTYCKGIDKNKNLHIVNPFSYKQKLKQFVGNKNSDRNIILVDAQGDSFKYVETLSEVLRYLPLGEIRVISYTSLKKVESYLESEIDEYNREYRVNILNGIRLNVDESPKVQIPSNSDLSDYFNSDLLDEYLSEVSRNNIVHMKYNVNFQDNRSCILSGNVLVGNKQVPISEINDYYIEEDFPLSISYYVQPDNFSLVSEIIQNFPRGKDVAYYSRLWKEKLYSYCKNEYNSDTKKMHKEQFPFLPKRMMNKYIDPDSTVDFPRSFAKVVRRMLALQLIDGTTANYMMSARKANSESTALGGKLKDALFQYKATGERNDFLADFDSKAQSRGEAINSDSLLEMCLKTNSVIKVNKQKQYA